MADASASLLARVASHADRTAVVTSEGKNFSYRDLDEASTRVASTLQTGCGHARDEARVAFLVPPGFEYVALLLGIWKAGGIAVPLAVSHPPAELDYVIRDAETAIVVSDPSFANVLMPLASAAAARFVTTDDIVSPTDAAGRFRVTLESANPALETTRRALMLYTSGTTGKPKGVVTTHETVTAQITSLVAAWEWTEDDRTLLVLPLHHIHGIINVVGSALWVGATCEMFPRFDAEAAWARLASGDLTVFTAVPTIYHRLIASWESAPPAVQRARSAGCRRMRLMMSGSAALPIQRLERWREISGHTLLERYGMTEIGMALSNPLRGERRPGFVGTPLPGVEVRLVDDAGGKLSPGAPGELEIRGSGVFQEYWRRPDATREAFRDGWFRTGDVAVNEDGAYRLLGRKSVDIIKSGGEKISALEIEEVVRLHPSIADCAAVGIADEMWDERVCVAVELVAGATLSLDDLRGWARERLAPAKMPTDLRVVASLPRNAMGKVVKPHVVALFLA